MKNNKWKKAKLLEKYLYHLEILKNINKILFDSTELFEKKYMTEFEFEQWRYFQKKITTFAKMINELNKTIDDETKILINKIKIERRIK